MRISEFDRSVLADAIHTSGLSSRKFAERVMGRTERTVRYWRAGTYPIPPVAQAFLRAYVDGRVRVSGPYLSKP